MFLLAVDLNPILNLWPYILLGGGAIGVGYGPEIYRWWKNRKAAAVTTTTTTTTTGETAAVPVGKLAEYLKALTDHCRVVKDDAALEACDKIAPTLFHVPETKENQTT
jgi:hypothetical protein